MKKLVWILLPVLGVAPPPKNREGRKFSNY